jgi:hypothetical protein
MNARPRPLPVLLVSVLYMVVGAVGFAVYLPRLIDLQPNSPWIELTELTALIAGVFLFRGCNWARWLAVVWMAFHAAISYPVVRQFVMHSIIFALIVSALFIPSSRRYFSPQKTE